MYGWGWSSEIDFALGKAFSPSPILVREGLTREGLAFMRSKKSLIIVALALAGGILAFYIWNLRTSAELRAFLAVDELDDMPDARDKIGWLSAADKATIRAILVEWQDQQAISNLLIESDLIPEDVRFAALSHGLTEQSVPYYVVSAISGLGKIDANKLSAEQRQEFREKLVAIIRTTDDVRAPRASLALRDLVEERDAPEVIGLMNHSDTTVLHNLRAWLFETFQARGKESFNAAVLKSGLTKETQSDLVAEFALFAADPNSKVNEQKTHVLFSYVPNLKDFVPGPER
jgi:hypothetical protein